MKQWLDKNRWWLVLLALLLNLFTCLLALVDLLTGMPENWYYIETTIGGR